jgi:uncharacterized protein YfaS (alpha-2-macroglobulin family)
MESRRTPGRQGRQRRGGAILAVAVILAAVLASAACSRGQASLRAPDPGRIEAHTAGLLPRSAEVRVVLLSASGEAGKELAVNPFSFSPPVAGKARWADERTVAFVPDAPLKAGTVYRARFDSGLLQATPGSPAHPSSDYFTFEFRTVDQRVDLALDPIAASRDGSLVLSGSITLTDDAPAAQVERLVKASGQKGGFDLAWSHDSGRVHRFAIKGIERSASGGQLRLSWNASLVGGSGSGSRQVRLPAKGAFEFIAATGDGQGALELAFSEPLDPRQDLRGMIGVDGVEDLRWDLDGGRVKLYAPSWPAIARIRVDPGLRSAGGAPLAKTVAAEVDLAWQKPEIRFLTKGTILPTGQGLALPLETMNVSAVIVEAYRIYGDNMLQFLQVNDLSSSNELRRVGEVVWRKTIDLGWKDDWKNRWVRQGLDLTALLAANKDGMFQIRVTFRKEGVRWVDPAGLDFKELAFPGDEVLDRDEYSMWDYVQTWPKRWDDYYKYKDNPSHPAFYLPSWDHDISIRRNVLVSDIGAIARAESDGTWTLAASDLRTTAPIVGAKVALYSYQRIQVAEGATGADGMVRLKPAKAPSFAILSNGGQKSYLSIGEGSSLPVSQFDVGGDEADTGLKGFIYGERGVWRPGDPIHLTFVLYDRTKTIPQGYPVTYQLEDPQGRVVRSGAVADSVNGFYAIETDTAADAPTGPYVARVKAGGTTFTKAVRVEAIMPNRLKVKLAWGDKAYLSADTPSMSLESTWLTGANAGALKADVSVTFAGSSTSFPGYPGFRFDDPTRSVPTGRSVLFDDRLGPDGKADFDVDLSPEGQAPGALKANILTRVFEPSGVFSSDSTQVDFHPYRQYVGLRVPQGDGWMGALPTDKQHKVDLALVDRDGKPVKSGKVEVALYKLEWRWWWEKGDESLAEIAEDLYARPLKKETVQVQDGKASWSFSVAYPSWGRYLIRVTDTSAGSQAARTRHAAGSVFYIDWPYGGAGRGDDAAATTLSLQVDKTKYQVGEKARVTFPSNAEGRALVAVERAGHLIRQEWVATSKDRTTYEFALTGEMAPNVYVHVTFLQPHQQTANDLPIRLYGVIPVMVEDRSTRLSPVLDVPAELAPNGEVAFKVRESQGRAMTCTVAVVDEGLLGITHYATPNPWDEFYRKEASALRSFDLYKYVAGAYSGKLETLLAVGGSDEGLGGGQRKVSRFPPVVYFFPAFEVKAGETVTKRFKLGPYVGAVRFMVVAGQGAMGGTQAAPAAGSAGAAFGIQEVSVPVRSKLMAQLTAPRIISVGEEAVIPATVFSFLGKSRARLALKVTGGATLMGPADQYLDFEADGDATASFRIKAGDVPGAVRISLAADSGSATAGQSIDLEVRALGAAVSSVIGASVDGGKTWSQDISYPGAPGSNSATIELSRLPPLDLGENLQWLIGYPHGCAEQTTSKAFPQLYLPQAVSLSADRLDEVKVNVNAAIAKLQNFQTPRGGFTLWPGGGDEEDWLSAYVTHFLVAARRAGYAVDNGLYGQATAFLSKSSRLWSSIYAWSKSSQAYRLYVLALAGKPELASMNRLREMKPLPAVAQYRLAAAYALAGQRDTANRLLGGAPETVEVYEGLDEYSYGTPFRERASILEALNVLGDSARGLALYKQLADELNSGRWFSTQELGAALSAALPYAAQAAQGEAPVLKVVAGDRTTASVKLDRAQATLDVSVASDQKARYTIVNTGRTPVFIKVVARGTPAVPDEKPVSKGLSLRLDFLDMNEDPVDPNTVAYGQDLIVEAVVRNLGPAPLRNLALTLPLPSGWEIVDFRPGEALPKPRDEDSYGEDIVRPEAPLYQYQDRRDDRVFTYFALDGREEKRFRIYVNRTYEGKFYLPAASVEAMYDARFQAVVPGRWLSEATLQATPQEKRTLRNSKP